MIIVFLSLRLSVLASLNRKRRKLKENGWRRRVIKKY
jgi:hypothetical protein